MSFIILTRPHHIPRPYDSLMDSPAEAYAWVVWPNRLFVKDHGRNRLMQVYSINIHRRLL